MNNESGKFVLIIAGILTPFFLCMNGGVVPVVLFWAFIGWYRYMTSPTRQYRKLIKDLLKEGIITEEDLKEI